MMRRWILVVAGVGLLGCGPWMRTLLGLPRPEGQLRTCTAHEEHTIAAVLPLREKSAGGESARVIGRAVRGRTPVAGAQIIAVRAVRGADDKVRPIDEAVLSAETRSDGLFDGVLLWHETGVLVIVDVFEPRSTATLLLEDIRDHCLIAEF